MTKQEQEQISQLSPLQRAFNKGGSGAKQYIVKTIDLSSINPRQPFDGNSLYDCTNLSFEQYPYLAPRKARTLVTTLTTPNAIFSTPDALVCVDGTAFKIRNADGTWTSKGAVTSGAKSMVEFNNKILIFPDKKYYAFRPTESFATLGTGAVFPADGGVPDIDYIANYRNRVFGVKNSSIYASKLGDAAVWNLYSVPITASDSFWSDVSSRGNFRGIVNYNDEVVTFKPNKMHEITLRKPPFSISDGVELGTLSQNSMAEVASVLYFAAKDGIYSFSGGMPRQISYPLNKTITSCVCGGDNKILYCCIYDGTSYLLYTYSTEMAKWLKEDELNVKQFHYFNDSLYALCADGKLYQFNSGTETITWSATTPNYVAKSFDKKEPLKLHIRLKITSGAKVDIAVSYDDKQFETVQSIVTEGLNAYEIPVMLQRCDRVKLKVSGTGYAEIYDLDFIYMKGSDING